MAATAGFDGDAEGSGAVGISGQTTTVGSGRVGAGSARWSGATWDLAGYPRDHDEVFTPQGLNPAYGALVASLEAMGPEELASRGHARDQRQLGGGVVFKLPGEPGARPFPLDLFPRVIAASDWAHLSAGLKQRALALNAFLGDIYANQSVLRDGVIPASVIESAPGFGRVGTVLGHQAVRAHVSGMDLVTDGLGAWYVLEDNLRVPSGMAYAMENRAVSDSIMADLPRPGGLVDVAGLPEMLAEVLRYAAPARAGSDPSVVLLSEGPGGPAWFEHRRLGAQMGIPVVTVTELLVQDDSVDYLDVDGNARGVDVVYVRMGESDLAGAAGADGRRLWPGLVHALHAGRVAVANGFGNGVGDDKAIYSFVGDFIRYYLGETPILSSVPTYLCSIPDQMALVLGRLDELVVKPVDGLGGAGVVVGPEASEFELGRVRAEIEAQPGRWIAQETISLSTHPCFDSARPLARHVDLRAFVFLSDQARVAPAALSRVAPPGTMVVNSSRGGGAKDSWLLT